MKKKLRKKKKAVKRIKKKITVRHSRPKIKKKKAGRTIKTNRLKKKVAFKKKTAGKVARKKPTRKKPVLRKKGVAVKRIPARQKKEPQPLRKRKFEFTKMVASGNDFIIFDNRRANLKNGAEVAARLCSRSDGIGADGLIFIERSRKADFKMRIFNPDGSEAEMCGNGIRCAALYKKKKNSTIATVAGFLKAELKKDAVKIKMTLPEKLQLNINMDIDGRFYQVNFINTGVPHAVYFTENIEASNVRLLGRLIRYHREFQPVGTNVDFVKIDGPDSIKIRTYERGVEAETLACGTGAVAAALIYHHKFLQTEGRFIIDVQTKSSEVLKVYFGYFDNTYRNVWLEGKSKIVYKGECYV